MDGGAGIPMKILGTMTVQESELLWDDPRAAFLNCGTRLMKSARRVCRAMRFVSKAKRTAELWSRAERIGRILYLSDSQAMENGRVLEPP